MLAYYVFWQQIYGVSFPATCRVRACKVWSLPELVMQVVLCTKVTILLEQWWLCSGGRQPGLLAAEQPSTHP